MSEDYLNAIWEDLSDEARLAWTLREAMERLEWDMYLADTEV